MLLPPLRVVGPRALMQGLKVDDLLVHRYSTVYQDGVELYGNAKCGLHYLIDSFRRAMCSRNPACSRLLQARNCRGAPGGVWSPTVCVATEVG